MGLSYDIQKAAAGHGRGCTCVDCLREYNGKSYYGFDTGLLWRLAAAALLLIAALAAAKLPPAVAVILSILSILAAGYDLFIRTGAVLLRERRVGEGLIMCLVAIAAVLLGRAREGAFYMLLLQAGVLLRGFILEKARRNVSGVAELQGEAGDELLYRMFSSEDENNRMEEFVVHFARYYTPIILLIAVFIALLGPFILHVSFGDSVYRAILFLAIACPWAVVASVPLAYRAGIGGAARQGVIFRDSGVLWSLLHIGSVVFDKSGALEDEGLRVVSVKSDRMEADVLLRIAAHACAFAEGAFADAIKAAYPGQIYIELLQSFRQDIDRGITVEVDGVSILLGSEEYIREQGVDPGADSTEEPGVYLAIDGQYAGRILFGSVVKPETAGAVSALAWEGERQVVMVTEESEGAAEKFAHAAGIARYHAALRAEEKVSLLRELENTGRESLMFVGDPVKDPGCFHAADIGVALGCGATAEAFGTADIVVTDASPDGVVTAVDTAKRVRTIALQGIIGALAIKVVILALDMAGVCPLWLGVLADTGAAMAAVLNCLRALVPKDSGLS